MTLLVERSIVLSQPSKFDSYWVPAYRDIYVYIAVHSGCFWKLPVAASYS